MGLKEFFRPAKSKIIVFIIILLIFALSNGLKTGAFGRPLTSTEKFLNSVPMITSPGINALLRDNGFFVGYKPYGTVDMVFEGVFHLGLDLIYWYALSCAVVSLIGIIKPTK